jgi:hypothetical protein
LLDSEKKYHFKERRGIKMGFEKFIPERVSTGEAKVTILPTGVFWINAITAKDFFEGFKRTFLLYDKEARAIGFQPTHEQEHSYSLSRAKGRKDITVSGTAFLECYKVAHEKRKNYKPTWNEKEKLVQIDLNEPL